MTDINPPSNPVESNWLSEAFENLKIQEREKKIIGEMLVEFFETERRLDLCLSIWFYPLVSDRHDSLRDDLVLYLSLGKKLDVAEKSNILDPSTVSLFRKVAQKRNSLAHPRPDKKRPGRTVSDKQKEQFVKDCQNISSQIVVKMKIHMKTLRNRHKELSSGLLPLVSRTRQTS